MTENGRVWTVKLSSTGVPKRGSELFCVNIPASISRALKQDGFTHAELTITEDGILLKPVALEKKPVHQGEVVVLPDSWVSA